MRRLSANTFVSIDGVMQAPGGPEEDPTGGFTLGGWGTTQWDDVMGEVMGRRLSAEPDDLLLGRKTYEIFAAHWPYVTDETAESLNAATKYVVSRTLAEATWSGSHILRDIDSVAALKREDGPDLQVQGSGNLLQMLLARDLVDELWVWTYPVVLGRGKRLFEGGAHPGGWTLVDSARSTTGVLIAQYQRAGDVPLGDFQLAEPTEAEQRRRANLA
ncbi:MAG: bifunctional deaminase-reductase domain protein [Acidimicrobiales bacterium]|nr:bifunctional deaminase-reductase domain protein [Acidimicrobiales bacterium]